MVTKYDKLLVRDVTYVKAERTPEMSKLSIVPWVETLVSALVTV